MKRTVFLIVLITLTVGIVIVGLIIFNRNRELQNEKIKIIDATYPPCSSSYQKFYEDNKYNYYFTCSKSDSVFVKFANGNKMLVVTALNEDKVTIDELIDAGLDVYREKK